MRIILMQRGADALYGSFAKRPDVGAWSPTLATKTSSGWGTQAPRVSNPASTCLAAPRATAFDDKNGDGRQRSYGVDPCDMPQGEDHQAGERNRSQVGAGSRLHGIGGQDAIVDLACMAALEPRQYRHGNQCRGSDADP